MTEHRGSTYRHDLKKWVKLQGKGNNFTSTPIAYLYSCLFVVASCCRLCARLNPSWNITFTSDVGFTPDCTFCSACVMLMFQQRLNLALSRLWQQEAWNRQSDCIWVDMELWMWIVVFVNLSQNMCANCLYNVRQPSYYDFPSSKPCSLYPQTDRILVLVCPPLHRRPLHYWYLN